MTIPGYIESVKNSNVYVINWLLNNSIPTLILTFIYSLGVTLSIKINSPPSGLFLVLLTLFYSVQITSSFLSWRHNRQKNTIMGSLIPGRPELRFFYRSMLFTVCIICLSSLISFSALLGISRIGDITGDQELAALVVGTLVFAVIFSAWITTRFSLVIPFWTEKEKMPLRVSWTWTGRRFWPITNRVGLVILPWMMAYMFLFVILASITKSIEMIAIMNIFSCFVTLPAVSFLFDLAIQLKETSQNEN